MREHFKKHIAVILTVLMSALFIPVASFASDDADDIKYSIDQDEELTFDEGDFNTVCDDLTGETLNYVKFDLPSSSKGVLYYDYNGDDEEEVSDSDKYYYDDDPNIGDVTFVPNSDYSGTVTISYTGSDTDGNDFSGEIKITVIGDDADDITYSVDSDETVDFDEDDFNDVCKDLTGSDLDYVNFTLPSSSKGVLYYKYDDGDYDSKVSKSTEYYYDDDPNIGDTTFVPNSDYSGTVSIGYTGYDKDGNEFSGDVDITVDDSSSSGDIEYSVDANDNVQFDKSDFNRFCKDENGETLDYVTFSLPSSSKGVLYYDYDGSDEEKVTTSEEYYYDDDPSIDDITFVPNGDYAGTVKIEFEGYDTSGDSIDGTIAISVSNEDLTADTIYLSGTAGSPVTMYDEYFNKQCENVLGNTLDYVKFTLPSASDGTLYYDYSSANDSSSLVSESTKYYYDDDSQSLSKVAFVSAGTGAGTYTLSYTGYDVDGGSFTGDVNLTITAKAATSASGSSSIYFTDVNGDYSWAVSYVDTLASVGIVTGESAADGTKHFNPGSNITRADFVVLLSRALNLSSASASGNFSDVAAGSYYYDALAAAKALGIAQGSDNQFYPNTAITREDAMVLAERALSVTGNSAGNGTASDLSAYTDNASVSSYATDSVAALVNAGIITGSDGQLHPKDNITRAEAAAMIYRIKY